MDESFEECAGGYLRSIARTAQEKKGYCNKSGSDKEWMLCLGYVGGGLHCRNINS